MQQSDTLRNTQCPPKVLSNDIRGHVDMVCQGDFIMHRLPDVWEDHEGIDAWKKDTNWSNRKTEGPAAAIKLRCMFCRAYSILLTLHGTIGQARPYPFYTQKAWWLLLMRTWCTIVTNIEKDVSCRVSSSAHAIPLYFTGGWIRLVKRTLEVLSKRIFFQLFLLVCSWYTIGSMGLAYLPICSHLP